MSWLKEISATASECRLKKVIKMRRNMVVELILSRKCSLAKKEHFRNRR